MVMFVNVNSGNVGKVLSAWLKFSYIKITTTGNYTFKGYSNY